jgi:hypothetical protein
MSDKVSELWGLFARKKFSCYRFREVIRNRVTLAQVREIVEARASEDYDCQNRVRRCIRYALGDDLGLYPPPEDFSDDDDEDASEDDSDDRSSIVDSDATFGTGPEYAESD